MSPIKEIEKLQFPWQTEDPFLFCVHHRDEFPAGNENMQVKPEYLEGRTIGNDFQFKDGWRMYHGQKYPGFPHHPHRGFETITINKEGVVDHSDSLGAAGRFMEGDVQWMTAGKGVNHSEMFPLRNVDKDNTMEIFQIWLNLPRKNKMVGPHFKMLWKEDIPVVEVLDEQGKTTTVDVIAGSYDTYRAPSPTPDSWASDSENFVRILTVKMESGAQWTLPETKAGVNRVLYFYKGSTLSVGGEPVSFYHRVVLTPEEDVEIKNTGEEEARILILEGRPIGEPVVQYGPFVMNTEQEIRQAMEDYQRTQFGGWPWKEYEMVHPKEKGRFALHSDGREEER